MIYHFISFISLSIHHFLVNCTNKTTEGNYKPKKQCLSWEYVKNCHGFHSNISCQCFNPLFHFRVCLFYRVCKKSGLCQPHHKPVSVKIMAYIGHNSAISLACVIKNSGLHRPQHSHITGLCQYKYWPASATPLTCVIRNTGLCRTLSATSLNCVIKNIGLHLPHH